jgi:hypothetical protein
VSTTPETRFNTRPAVRTAGKILPPIEADCTSGMRFPKTLACGLATCDRIDAPATRLECTRAIGHETLDSLLDWMQNNSPKGYFGPEQEGEMEITVGVRFKPKAHKDV